MESQVALLGKESELRNGIHHAVRVLGCRTNDGDGVGGDCITGSNERHLEEGGGDMNEAKERKKKKRKKSQHTDQVNSSAGTVTRVMPR